MKKQAKKKRATPHVNGERTSFVHIGNVLSCDRETAALYYKAISGKVTWSKLWAQKDRAWANRRKEVEAKRQRDARITAARQNRRRPLSSIAATFALSRQRIQQIAGSLQ